MKNIYTSLLTIYEKIQDEREQWILWLPVIFAGGILLYFFLDSEPDVYLGRIILASLVVLLFITNYNLIVVILLCFTCGFCCIHWRAVNMDSLLLREEIKYIELTGRLVSITPLPGKGSRLIIDQVKTETLYDITIPAKIRIVVKTKLNDAKIGDKIKLKAVLLPLAQPVVPGGYNFARSAYFEQIGASGYSISAIEVLEPKHQDIRNYLANLRANISQEVLKIMGSREGNIATALMVGEYHAIDDKLLAAMRISGISHILSVSGMHLSLVAAIFFFAVRFILALLYPYLYKTNTKKTAAFIAVIGSFSYLLISGMQVAAIRAFVMTSAVLFAVIIDRMAYPMRSVMLAALVILLLWPESILNVSFQMSFMAVIALIASYELYKKYLPLKLSEWNITRRIVFYIISTIGSSLIAGLATAPFVIYHFNQYSNYGVLANLFAVPVTSFLIMPCVILAFLLYPFGLAKIALIPMGYGIRAMIFIANIVKELPHSVKVMHYMPVMSLLFIVIGLLWLCLWRSNLRLFSILPLITGLLLYWFTPLPNLLIDSKSGIAAIYSDKQLVFLARKVPRFLKENWMRYMGQEKYVTIADKPDTGYNHEIIATYQALCTDEYGSCAIFLGKKVRVETAINPANNRYWDIAADDWY